MRTPRMVHRFRFGVVIAVLLAGLGLVVLAQREGSLLRIRSEHAGELEGRDEREPVSHRPTVEAAFAAESYRAGGVARLVFFDAASGVTVRLYRVGDAVGLLRARDAMRGTPVARTRWIRSVTPGSAVRFALAPTWPSGLYFARLTAPGGRTGYAPFVLTPRRLGEHRIAVVLPTQTWQAYNFRDDDGNGTSDTWYASADVHTARLFRPFENRGVPPHYRHYDEPFLRWIARSRYPVDFLSDGTLKSTSGDALARAYQLLIFSGHHEYVTSHEYDVVTRFRDRGGNLMFLSANNFFYKITISGDVMTRVGQWRNLDRPEGSLIGVEYFAWDSAGHGGSPWTVRNAPAGRWIFARTGLHPGSNFASGGIEADGVDAASPRNVQVLAEIEHVFGGAHNAQMTYYQSPSGGKVFAAGAFSLACSIWQPPVRQLVANLIAALAPAAVQ